MIGYRMNNYFRNHIDIEISLKHGIVVLQISHRVSTEGARRAFRPMVSVALNIQHPCITLSARPCGVNEVVLRYALLLADMPNIRIMQCIGTLVSLHC